MSVVDSPSHQQTGRRPLRIGNASGFLGDRASALRELVEGGPLDVVCGDYLAELTMGILGRQRLQDPTKGFASTFLRHLEPVFAAVLEKRVKIVVNAGGLNPEGLAAAVQALARKLGLEPAIATVLGDDLKPRLAELRAAGEPFQNLETGAALPDDPAFVRTANAYLGGFGIARALEAGADLVICPRVTDAALTIGPAIWWHGWSRDDLNALAGALAAGHIIECGTQATGGNYSGFKEIEELLAPGFPIAEIAADGSSVITKHPGTGGAVTVGTVTAQLVYEVASERYLNPDVTLRLDSLKLAQLGRDRVAVSGALGLPPPATTKVAITTRGGFRNEMTFAFVGLDLDAKIALFERGARAAVGPGSRLEFHRLGGPRAGGLRQDDATQLLRVVASSADEASAGRSFSSGLIELALASYPGLFTLAPPGPAHEAEGFWPALVPQRLVPQRVALPSGAVEVIAGPASFERPAALASPTPPAEAAPTFPGPRRRVALGVLVDGRSGDKGSHANLGLWARSERAYAWLKSELTVERLRALLPEAEGCAIERFELPNLKALNFVIAGLLGGPLAGGAGASLRLDRQAKALAEFVRSREVHMPLSLLDSKPAASPSGSVLVKLDIDEGVARVTLDSPENRNALSAALVQQLLRRMQEATCDASLRALVLTGTGSTFCAGADLKAMASPAAIRESTAAVAGLLETLTNFPVPVIVALNGKVRAGGLGLLGAADVVVGPADATFAFTEVRLGVVPAMISAPLVRRMTPRGIQRYFLTGEEFDAAEAERIGLLSLAVPPGEVERAVERILEGLRLASPTALATTKAMLREIGRRSLWDDLSFAQELSAQAFESPDAQEGLRAFREKRPPSWAVKPTR